jgi:uncharacterized protein (TIGR02145 family)
MKKSVALLFLFCTAIFAQQKGTFADPRDGKRYRTVKIGEQTWIAENLNYNANGSKCYRNEPANCDKYGRLYDWNTAKAACPKGWHLPSDEEWDTLMDFVGGSSTAETKLKVTNGWNHNGNGTDEDGFAALPGGNGFSDGNFHNVGYGGHWWSASENYANNYRYMYYSIDGTFWFRNSKSLLFSVRCVGD